MPCWFPSASTTPLPNDSFRCSVIYMPESLLASDINEVHRSFRCSVRIERGHIVQCYLSVCTLLSPNFNISFVVTSELSLPASFSHLRRKSSAVFSVLRYAQPESFSRSPFVARRCFPQCRQSSLRDFSPSVSALVPRL